MNLVEKLYANKWNKRIELRLRIGQLRLSQKSFLITNVHKSHSKISMIEWNRCSLEL